ncbi:DHA2 family efflux MFS transporter permease subunit [Photobacterium lucens]|uniref:DHA2 family efflux MFS transporter permease subunit n=1 Tax=Photobacterium lucens TaxID=2562949 RepID=UPI000D173708|nr:DHA2 family efflux MFS transporter permease subunit [Photobacterium lucens]MBP2702026.1 DHA2 family efflux MFS transporter permease subunit [Vibrio parahaemolyticus]MZG57792.1 DHA2 family efflux MFS transporter permease subunit [Photobacterium lucens]MZG79196.1 DHA2 family efflux MFS transporter permease subunit [Photobacterium lucens]PSV21373.1 MFS transporter [Photobacterium leiognathi subsp. mandapamensis]
MTGNMTPTNRLLITCAVMLSAIMVLLDMTIANVALPHMMGALGVTSEQVTWVLTSYSMAEAIFIPLASYLSLKFGIRKLLLVSVAGFVITSALCGQADSLAEMVVFRIMQGAFGASVIPLSQSIMVQIYPPEERGKAMALFSVGVLLGPILGPTVGGIITENMDWRWIFYVNLPIGMICLSLLYLFVKLDGRGESKIDWPLVIGMTIGIGLLQMVLDRGNEEGWFESNLILFSAVISVIAWIFFIARSWITKGDIAPMWLLKDRNLAVSCLMMAGFSMGMFGITQLQPMMLEQLLRYPVETTGFVMAPRGLTSAIVLLVIARYMDRLDPRMLVAVGLGFNIIGTYLMMQYSMNIDHYWVLMPSIVQGLGMGLVFAPLSQMAYRTLSPENTVGGAVVFNLCRTIGGSFGISIVNTYFTRTEQREWHALGSDITLMNPELQQQAMMQHTTVTDPHFMAQIGQLLHQQSTLLAFTYTFGFIFVSYIVLLPLLTLFKLKKGVPGAGAKVNLH